MAKEEFDAWNGYLQARKEDLPKPDFEIEQKDYSQVKEDFDRFKVTFNISYFVFRTGKHIKLPPLR
jgi:hypothetical protein